MKLTSKLLWWGALAASTAVLLILPASKGETVSKNGIIIMSTASVNGEISPCG